MKLWFEYLKSAFVHLYKNFTISAFLIVGFGMGMSIGLFALMIWNTQKGFDNRIQNIDHLARVTTRVNQNWHYAASPASLLDEIKTTAIVSEAYQIIPIGRLRLGSDLQAEQFAIEGSAAFVSNGLFERFNFDFISYESVDLAVNPDVVFITDVLAKKIFGVGSALNRSLVVEGFGEFVVKGIINSGDYQYHIQQDLYFSRAKMRSLILRGKLSNRLLDDKNYEAAYTYVDLESSIDDSKQGLLRILGTRYSEIIKSEKLKSYEFYFQPIENIIFDKLIQDTPTVFNQPDFYQYFIIAMVVLLASAANFFNIQFFNLMKRLKEFGIRRVNGANDQQVFSQILVENVVLSLLGLIAAFLLIWILPFPQFPSILQNTSVNTGLIFSILLFGIGIGVLTGLLPAYIITKRTAMYSLKSEALRTTQKTFSFANLLLGIQLILTILFVFNLLLVERQTRMALHMDYGYDINNIVSVEPSQISNPNLLKVELLRDSRVNSVSFTSRTFGSFPGSEQVVFEGLNDSLFVNYYSTDEGFLDIHELNLLHGRNFSDNYHSDKLEDAIVINEKAMKLLSPFPSEVLGKIVTIQDSIQVQIIGIIEDFHFDNLKRSINPLIIRIVPSEYKVVNIRLNDGVDLNDYVTDLNDQLDQLGVEKSQVSLYEELITDKLSHTEDRVALGLIASFIIIITCMGLIGTILVNAEKMKKIVAINKLFGASNLNLIIKLARQYIIVLSIGFLIALPIAYFIGMMILSEFAFRVPIGYLHFIQVILPCTLLVMTIVISQIMRYSKITVLQGLNQD